jgi:hypothetical protein
MADASQQIKNSTAAAKGLAAALGITQKQAKEVLKAMQDLGTVTENSAKKTLKSTRRTLKSFEETRSTIADLKNDVYRLGDELAKMHMDKALNSKKAKDLHDELKAINAEINKVAKNGTFEEKRKSLTDLRDRASDVKDEMGDIKKASNFKMKFMKMEGWKNMFTEISKAPDLFGMMGGAIKGLGGSLGGVTKLLGGWPMLIFSAVKAFADVTLAADQFVKDQNKIFLRMRGPDIMTPDVEKQFEEFNSEIFKAGENIRVGLNVKDIQSFMEAVTAAGAHISSLNQGLTNYRYAIYVASKASKTLGMDLPWVGQKMADLLTEFRANMDEIDSVFVQVAFDAKKAGLSTDKFWNVIQNATASMTFFGIGIKGASKTMKAFSENAVGGAKDAGDAVQNMYDVFGSMDLSKVGAALDIAGNWKEAFGKVVDELKNKKVAIHSKIEVLQKTGDTAAIEKLRAQEASIGAKIIRYNKAMSGNSVDAVKYAAALGQDVEGQNAIPEILTQLLKNVGNGQSLSHMDSSTLTQVVQSANAAFGIGAKTTMEIVGLAENIAAQLDDLSNMTDEDLKNFLNTDSPMARRLADVIKEDTDGNDLLQKAQSKDQESLNILRKRFKTDKVIDKLTLNNYKKEDESSGDMADQAEDTFKQIVGQTLSMKEMIEMGKDEAHYRFASLGIFTGIGKAVDYIANNVGGAGKYQSEQQEVAKAQLEEAAQTDAVLASLLKEKGEAGTAEALTKTIHRLSGMIKPLTEMTSVISNLDVSNIDDGIAKLGKLQEKEYKLGHKETAIAIGQKRERLQQIKLSKDQKKGLSEIQTTTEQELKESSATLTNAQSALENLETLNKTNKDISDYAELTLEANPEAMERLGKKLLNQKQGRDAILKQIGPDMADAAMAAVEKSGAAPAALAGLKKDIDDLKLYNKNVGYSLANMGVSGVSQDQKAEGGIISKPTRTLLGERGPEAVIPLGKGGGMSMGGLGRTIQINVSATEKDLASRIANEVRSVLYKERIG